MHGSWCEYKLEKKKTLIFIEALFATKAEVHINISEEKIILLSSTPIENLREIDDEDDRLFLLYFHKIFSRGILVRSCEDQFRMFNSRDVNAILSHRIIPNYLFLDSNDPYPVEISSYFGIIAIGKDMSVKSKNIFDLHIHSFQRNVLEKVKEYFKEIPQSNAVVIQDPYILKEGNVLLRSLINSIIDFSSLKIKPTITFLLREGEGDISILKQLEEEYQGKFDLEIIYSHSFHDRNIYTNTTWISSDYGFRREYGKSSTKWCGYPIGTYYDLYYKKLDEIKKYLVAHNTKTSNSLIN